MTENFSQAIMSNTKPQIRETQRTLTKKNTGEKTAPYVYPIQTVKNQTLKKKILKEVRREKIKTLLKRVGKIRITSDFISESMQARIKQKEIVKALRGKTKLLTRNSIS